METAPKEEGDGLAAGREVVEAAAPRDRLVTRSDAPASASRLVLLALAISGIAHLAFLMPAVILGDARPLDTSPVQAISVEIVPPEEETKPASEPAPETKPETKSEPPAETKSAPPSSPPPDPPAKPMEMAAPPSAPRPLPEAWPQPEPAPSAPGTADVFGLPLALPGGMIGYEYQPAATEKADIAEEAKAAFRRHLKTCATLPARMAAQSKVTLRIHLNPDGTLIKGLGPNPHAVGKIYEPTTGGGDLLNAASAAVIKCQPFTMLPADRYDEWREIDLTFTPRNFPGE